MRASKDCGAEADPSAEYEYLRKPQSQALPSDVVERSSFDTGDSGSPLRRYRSQYDDATRRLGGALPVAE